jgi:hypothetical protein
MFNGSRTAAKTATIIGYAPVVGGVLEIDFTNGNTAPLPTLNISSGVAIPIYVDGSAAGNIPAGFKALLCYDGTNYNIINMPVRRIGTALGATTGTISVTMDSAIKTITPTATALSTRQARRRASVYIRYYDYRHDG